MANTDPDVSSLDGLSCSATHDSVPLVASVSVMNPAEEVHAVPTITNNGRRKGAFTWWIRGDSSKAMLNVDRMTRDGLLLTSFYARPACGASRASLMTGCYPIRVAEPGNLRQSHSVLHPWKQSTNPP